MRHIRKLELVNNGIYKDMTSYFQEKAKCFPTFFDADFTHKSARFVSITFINDFMDEPIESRYFKDLSQITFIMWLGSNNQWFDTLLLCSSIWFCNTVIRFCNSLNNTVVQFSNSLLNTMVQFCNPQQLSMSRILLLWPAHLLGGSHIYSLWHI